MMSIDSSLPIPASGDKRASFHLPLSQHGLPKPPPGPTLRPHRFSTMGSPSPVPSHVSSPPLTPGPFSPPMSAKSFGTFIDSEPSTPAYSPRQGTGWDSSTLMLLSPARSSAPSSPAEPEWEMMMPLQQPKTILKKPRVMPPPTVTEISTATSLSSRITKPLLGDVQKENQPPTEETDEERRAREEQAAHAPLGTLVTRMKSMLRRKTANEKKSEKKRRRYQDLERMDTMHWTEM